MERLNFQAIEKNGSQFLKNKNFITKKFKKIYCLEMFPYLQVKFIWDM